MYMQVLFDISQLLNTQLDRETLATCVNMIESGVHPEALAVNGSFPKRCVCMLKVSKAVIQELRRKSVILGTKEPQQDIV